jgi:mRNA interferase MazF
MTGLKRGDVVWVKLDPTVGAEIKKERPCVILSLTVLNDKRATVVVVPLASSGNAFPPLVVAVPSVGPRSNARIDQLRAVDKSRVGRLVGKLPNAELREIEKAVIAILGL